MTHSNWVIDDLIKKLFAKVWPSFRESHADSDTWC